MVYLHKVKTDSDRIMCYEYGSEENVYLGKIQFDIDVPKSTDFEHRNLKLEFYNGAEFNRCTSSALQGIAKFVRENKFPDDYLRVTH